MTESEQATENIANREISRFSVVVLGYDRDHPDADAVRPRELLEWVRHQKQRQAERQKARGAIVLAILTTVATLAVTAVWQPLAGWLTGSR